jgi:hypothetical protein
MDDVLKNIRSLLLLWSDLTAIVGERIRPNGFHSTDGDLPAVMMELPDGRQMNTLDRSEAIIDATLTLTTRAPLASDAASIAAIIRSRNTTPSTGLDGYSGSAGTGIIKSCERMSFETGIEVDDDGTETGNHLHVQVFQILFQLGG